MMSETAFFIKDIVSPNGAVSITDGDTGSSDDVDGDTKVGGLLVHCLGNDTLIKLPDEPGHQRLCDAEQAWILGRSLTTRILQQKFKNLTHLTLSETRDFNELSDK